MFAAVWAAEKQRLISTRSAVTFAAAQAVKAPDTLRLYLRFMAFSAILSLSIAGAAMPYSILVSNQSEREAFRRSRRVLDAWLNRLSATSWQGSLSREGLEDVIQRLAALRSRHLHIEILQRKGMQYVPVRMIGSSAQFHEGRVSLGVPRADARKQPEATPVQQLLRDVAALSAICHDPGKAACLERSARYPMGRKGFQRGMFDDPGHFLAARHECVSAQFYLSKLPLPTGTTAILVDVPECLQLPKINAVGAAGFGAAQVDRLVYRLIATHHALPMDWDNPDELRFFSKDGNQHLRTENYRSNTVGGKDVTTYTLTPIPGADDLEKHRAALDASLAEQASQPARKPLAGEAAAPTLGELLAYSPEYFYVLSRLALIFGDHAASAEEKLERLGALPTKDRALEMREAAHALFKKGIPLAKSDIPVTLAEHLRDVYDATRRASNFLQRPQPTVQRTPASMQSSPSGRFAWQGMGADAITAARLGEHDGFFGIVLAGTGSGKTRGGYRLASAMRDGAPRFTLALAQGALAVQQGIEYRSEVGLTADESAIMVGWRSQPLLREKLAALETPPADAEPEEVELVAEVDGGDAEGLRSRLLAHLPPSERSLINTPVVVMTIDHLMSALAGHRGAFVPAMTRMATADLVIDEIDAFSTMDLHAVGRLIYLAGLMGRRVLIESASVTPEISDGLFTAYAKGYQQYRRVHGGQLHAGWFGDQMAGLAEVAPIAELSEFALKHLALTSRIRDSVLLERPRRKLGFVPITAANWHAVILQAAVDKATESPFFSTPVSPKASLSTAFVRFNSTRSAFAFARALPKLIKKLGRTDIVVKSNVLTSKLDNDARRYLERKIGELTKRKTEEWRELPEVRALKTHTLFLLIATPILEVGRDFDFDFCILEPSSDASIIQSAGRILRHRLDCYSDSPNILMLSESIRGLEAELKARTKPEVKNKPVLHYGAPGAGVEQPPKAGFWSEYQQIAGQAVPEKFSAGIYEQGIHAGHRISEAVIPSDQLDRALQSAVLISNKAKHDEIGPDTAGAVALSSFLDRHPFFYDEPPNLRFRYDENGRQSAVLQCSDTPGKWLHRVHADPADPTPGRVRLKEAAITPFFNVEDKKEFCDQLFFQIPEPRKGVLASVTLGRADAQPSFQYHPAIGFADPEKKATKRPPF